MSQLLAKVKSEKAQTDILYAAAHCFMERGFAATSIDDVAAYLGATKGMIYHYYRSKTDLFFDVYRMGMELNFNAILPHVENSYSAVERLQDVLMSHTINLMANLPFQRVVTQGVWLRQTSSVTVKQSKDLAELMDSRNDFEKIIREVVIEAATDAGIDVGNPSFIVKSVLGSLNNVVYWYSPRRKDVKSEQQAIAQHLVKFAMQGIGFQNIEFKNEL